MTVDDLVRETLTAAVADPREPEKWEGMGRRAWRESGRRVQDETRREMREEMLVALLQGRFGADTDVSEVAKRLAGWPNAAVAIYAVTSARDLRQLEDVPSLV